MSEGLDSHLSRNLEKLIDILICTEPQNVCIGKDFSQGHLVQPSCSNRATNSRLSRTVSRQFLDMCRDGDSTTSVSNLCQ